MPTEPSRVPTAPTKGWSVDTALDHVLALVASNDRRYEERFDAQEKAVTAAITAADRAVQKAETAAEKRFESVNEFRSTLGDQQRTLMPRSEVEVIMRAQSEKIAALEKRFEGTINERRGVQQGWGYAVGAVGFIVALLSLIARFRP